MPLHRLRQVALHSTPGRSQRDSRDFHHGLLEKRDHPREAHDSSENSTALQLPPITLAVINALQYAFDMIRSFRDAQTKKVFNRERSRKLPPDIQRRAHRKLLLLDAAEQLRDLRVPPGNRLERLAGDREGEHSIRINDQWRICFRWHGDDVFDVEITDYH